MTITAIAEKLVNIIISITSGGFSNALPKVFSDQLAPSVPDPRLSRPSPPIAVPKVEAAETASTEGKGLLNNKHYIAYSLAGIFLLCGLGTLMWYNWDSILASREYFLDDPSSPDSPSAGAGKNLLGLDEDSLAPLSDTSSPAVGATTINNSTPRLSGNTSITLTQDPAEFKPDLRRGLPTFGRGTSLLPDYTFEISTIKPSTVALDPTELSAALISSNPNTLPALATHEEQINILIQRYKNMILWSGTIIDKPDPVEGEALRNAMNQAFETSIRLILKEPTPKSIQLLQYYNDKLTEFKYSTFGRAVLPTDPGYTTVDQFLHEVSVDLGKYLTPILLPQEGSNIFEDLLLDKVDKTWICNTIKQDMAYEIFSDGNEFYYYPAGLVYRR